MQRISEEENRFRKKQNRQSGDWRSQEKHFQAAQTSGLFCFQSERKIIGVFVAACENWRRETSGLRNALSYTNQIQRLRCAKIRRGCHATVHHDMKEKRVNADGCAFAALTKLAADRYSVLLLRRR